MSTKKNIFYLLAQKFSFCDTQVIIVSSEIDRGGFEAPSVTFVPLNAWKNSATMEQCNEWLQTPPYLSIEDCIERNTMNKSEVFKNIFLGLKKQKSVLGKRWLIVEGLINNFQRAKYFTVNLRDNVTPKLKMMKYFLNYFYLESMMCSSTIPSFSLWIICRCLCQVYGRRFWWMKHQATIINCWWLKSRN